MSTITASVNPTVDGLVEAVTVKLQLTPAQEELAQKRAAGVSAWLNAPGTVLAGYAPEIFYQGSMRHGTTVRPKLHTEYDLDLVCLLRLLNAEDLRTPEEIYELVYLRLHESAVYRPLLERMNRCIRLVYTNDFHLDILPSRPDWARGDTNLLVPDRELRCWKPSNPKGFAEWFDHQATSGARVLGRQFGDVLTASDRLQMKATLRRVVQLMKRRREILFDGDQSCARSVVLTTLAGADYDGQFLCTDALISVLDAILQEFDGVTDPPPVPNPTNPDENFAEKWTRKTFDQFMGYIRLIRTEMHELLELHDLEAIHAMLKRMFGEGIATDVVKELAGRMRDTKDARVLRWAGPAVTLTARPGGAARAIPANTFHGDPL